MTFLRSTNHLFRILLSITSGYIYIMISSAPATAADRNMVLLQTSRPLVARTSAWQTWNDHIHLKPGQEKRKLYITFINGADGRAKLTGLKVLLNRQPFITLQDFGQSNHLDRNLTHTLKPGDTLVTTQVFGPSGARLVWKVFAEKVSISVVSPNPFSLIDQVIVSGKNFSTNPNGNKVFIGKAPATVMRATNSELQLKLSPNTAGGPQDLVVYADSIKSNSIRVKARVNPKITWVDFVATAPGQPVVISGNGFSSVPSENLVTFGNLKAEITHATTSSLTCIVPDMTFPRWHVPIVVTTHGVASKEQVFINIDQRVIPNEGVPQF